MTKRLFLYILLLLLAPGYIVNAQINNSGCQPEKITDQRDLPENIPGETMGQKLESLLFWSQEERVRRFPIMHNIYPSLLVEANQNTKKVKPAKKLKKKWQTNTGLDVYMQENRVAGVIVMQNNKVKLEAYGEGMDEKHLWTSFSVAKSVTSMLTGVAMKDGYIRSIEDRLDSYIPELKGYDYGTVTVRQLLTMTSGMNWNEDYEDPNSDVAQMYQAECVGEEAHILSYMKKLKRIHPGGEKWNYSTGETDLLGILVHKATGKTVAEYLSEKIWKPYNMQQCAFWLADECSGINIGGSGLSASLRDFARLGQLMLDNGKINGESIFSEEWLKDAASLLYKPNKDADGGYGYLWWRNADGSYMAEGIFGQMVYINPAKNLVIAQVAAWPQAGSEELSIKRQSFIDAVERLL